MRITVLVDDIAPEGRMPAVGFAALVETSGATLLFDTGPDGDVLMRALEAVGVSLVDLDMVLISHDHPDHTGGLARVLYDVSRLPVSAPIAIAPSIAKTLPRDAVVLGERGPRTLFPNVRTTGNLPGDIAEQALVLSTDKGEVVLVGCCHSGLGMLLAAVGGQVEMVVGGLHDLSDEDVGLTSLNGLVACHCTPKKRVLAHGYDWISMGQVGTVLEFTPPPELIPKT
jgi:7,8-dihydropterin-6-yl-methyl-4-(beta-D-ribofuranosyl)aminobenzene 5'-phosphate synthase